MQAYRWCKKRNLQISADAAIIAAGWELAQDNEDGMDSAAYREAQNNGFDQSANSEYAFNIVEYTENGVQYAIEKTSRYAALNEDLSDAEFQSYAEDQLSSMFVRPASFNLSSSRITSGGVNFVEVSADYSHATMAGGLLGDFGNVNFSTYSRKPIVN